MCSTQGELRTHRYFSIDHSLAVQKRLRGMVRVAARHASMHPTGALLEWWWAGVADWRGETLWDCHRSKDAVYHAGLPIQCHHCTHRSTCPAPAGFELDSV